MANPRKFSEKIALQKQKQAEGTAEFEKIMKEVLDATSKDESLYNQRLADCGGGGSGGGGGGGCQVSNTSNMTTSTVRESRGRSVGVGPMRRPSDRRVDRSPYSSGNVAYLSPPSDSFWRRANSDSAIHQSLNQAPEKNSGSASHSPLALSPTSQRRSIQTNSINNHHHHNHHNHHENRRNNLHNANNNRNSSNIDIRQGSPCGINSRLPCNNIYTHENSLAAPIGNNTGSLPDLTSVHFSSSLNKQLIEKEREHSSSPYSSSPLTTSPTTLSPTSIPNRYQYSPAHSPSESNTYSPTHFSSNIRQNYLSVPGNENNSNHHFNSHKEVQFDDFRSNQMNQTSHLSFTNLPGLVHIQNNNSSKSGNISNNSMHSSHGHLSSIGIAAAGNLTEYRNPQSRPSPGSSPGIIPSMNESNPSAPCSPVPQNFNNNNSQTYDKYQNQNNDAYNLNQSFHNHFEQFSLVDNSEQITNLQQAQNNFTTLQFSDNAFTHLGSLSTNSSNQQQQQQSQQAQQQQQIQQLDQDSYNLQQLSDKRHQQQDNLISNTNSGRMSSNNSNATNLNCGGGMSGSGGSSGRGSPCNSMISGGIGGSGNGILINDPHQQQQHHQHHHHGGDALLSQQQQQQQQLRQNHYQSPNTPTSIPEIVFSDFSTNNTDFSKEIFGSLDLELGPMDVVGLQMLSDPNSAMIADPTIEDSFRQDLN